MGVAAEPRDADTVQFDVQNIRERHQTTNPE